MAAATVATTPEITATTGTPGPVLKLEVMSSLVQDIVSLVKQLQLDLKTVKKEVDKVVKEKGRKKASKSSSANDGSARPPSGFAKAASLSNELCVFLGVDNGTQMARTEVTRRVNDYIKEHNLQDPKDRRNINPDAKLASLIIKADDVPLTYFNLQKCIKHHFLPAASTSGVTA